MANGGRRLTQGWWIAIHRLIGLDAWKIWFHSDTHLIFLAIFYSFLLSPTIDFEFLGPLLLVASLELYGALAVMINDYFDMPSDAGSGRGKTIFYMKRWQIYGLTSILVLSGLGVAIFLLGRLDFVLMYAIACFMAILYSAPPARLKTKGIHGIWCDALIETTIPVILVFLYFQHLDLYTYFFVMLCFVFQIENIISHQIDDYAGDLKTSTNTFVVQIGRKKTIRLRNRYLRPILAFLILMLGIFISVRSLYFFTIFGVLLVGFFFIQKFVKIARAYYFIFWSFSLVSVYPISLGIISTLLHPPYALLLLFALSSQYPRAKSFLRAVQSIARALPAPSVFRTAQS